jgi:hypothetical protein
MLGVARLEDVDGQRAQELAAMLAEVVGNYDQLAWGTWKVVAPASAIKRQQNLKQLIGRFAAGDASVSRGQVKQELDRLRQLGAALIASLNQAGRQFAQKQATTLAPSQIESAVRLGAKSVMTGHEVQCWRKYVELAGTHDVDGVERELLSAMASHAEALMKGAGGQGKQS